jgi:hypothetical protein
MYVLGLAAGAWAFVVTSTLKGEKSAQQQKHTHNSELQHSKSWRSKAWRTHVGGAGVGDQD